MFEFMYPAFNQLCFSLNLVLNDYFLYCLAATFLYATADFIICTLETKVFQVQSTIYIDNL